MVKLSRGRTTQGQPPWLSYMAEYSGQVHVAELYGRVRRSSLRIPTSIAEYSSQIQEYQPLWLSIVAEFYGRVQAYQPLWPSTVTEYSSRVLWPSTMTEFRNAKL